MVRRKGGFMELQILAARNGNSSKAPLLGQSKKTRVPTATTPRQALLVCPTTITCSPNCLLPTFPWLSLCILIDAIKEMIKRWRPYLQRRDHVKSVPSSLSPSFLLRSSSRLFVSFFYPLRDALLTPRIHLGYQQLYASSSLTAFVCASG